jgi:broad specificity phosphatase PhoE
MNHSGQLQGAHANGPLDANGQLQAELLGKIGLQHTRCGLIASSPMLRAVQTADIVAAWHEPASTVPRAIIPELTEIDFGKQIDGQRTSIAEAKRQFQSTWDEWARANFTACGPNGGESLHAIQDRFAQGISRLYQASRGHDAIVVTHSGLLSVFMTAARNYLQAVAQQRPIEAEWWCAPLAFRGINDEAHRSKQTNTGINELVFQVNANPPPYGLVEITRENDHRHLDAAGIGAHTV